MKLLFGSKKPPHWWKSARNIGGVVIPVIIIALLVVHQANFLVGRSLLIAFGDTESTYRSAWFEWGGDVVARDVVIDPYGLGKDYAIRAEKIRVETPGWMWFVWNTFRKSRLTAKMDEVHLTLTGVETVAGLDPTLGDLGPFGGHAASPFEAEGCLQDGFWVEEELRKMGLEPGPSELEFHYVVNASLLSTTIRYETPGVSKVVFERKEDLPRQINALLLDQYPALVRSESWMVEDAGFTRARNRFCAAKDGAESRDIIERHVASVQRLLEMGGIQLDQDSLTAYRLFVRDGGSLKLSLDYNERIHSDVYYEIRNSGEALFLSRAILDRGERRHAMQWSRITPRELKGWEDGMPTYAALRREEGKDTLARAEYNTVARIDLKKVAAKVNMEDAGERDPALDAALLAPPVAAELPVEEKPEPVQAVAQVDPRIPWDALNDYIGRDLRVVTATSGTRAVFLLEAGPDDILVRAQLGGGHAEYRIKKDTFREAALIQ